MGIGTQCRRHEVPDDPRVERVAGKTDARVAKETAEKARRTAMLAGFVTAASLLLSLAAAWWAAIRGGHHRDHSIPARLFGAQGSMRRA